MKKAIAVILVLIMLVDMTSCHSYKELSVQQDYQNYQQKHHVEILEIQTEHDKIIAYNKKFPGKLVNNYVNGLQQIHIPYGKSDSLIFDKKDKTPAYAVFHGIQYRIVKQDNFGLICVSTDTIRIPFSEITNMNLKIKYPGKTALVILLGVSAVIIGILGIIDLRSTDPLDGL